MKTEMVVRGRASFYPSGAVDKFIARGGPGLNATLLLHGPNGEVGGLEAGQLESIEMCIRFAADNLDISYLADLIILRDAIANILNPEQSDE